LKKTILCIATLDTKGPEVQYVKELIEKRGYAALVMDIGSLERAPFTPDITAEEVARAAGSTIQEVRGFREAGPAAEVMASGAVMADIAGLNRLTRKALSDAAGAIVGMVESAEPEISEKPFLFMTMLGTTTGCGLKVKSLLEDKGFEVAVFHTIGIGGMTFEELLKDYPVKGVVELGLNEIGNELFGGLASAGPNRLEAAGMRGIPQIITPGNVDFINFLAPETVPERYRNRTLCFHNPQATLPRLNGEELELIGETVAKKLNLATGPVKVLIPTRGFSSLDRKGNIFYDPMADKAFVEALKNSLKETIELKEIDVHINDGEFAEAVASEFINLVKLAQEGGENMVECRQRESGL